MAVTNTDQVIDLQQIKADAEIRLKELKDGDYPFYDHLREVHNSQRTWLGHNDFDWIQLRVDNLEKERMAVSMRVNLAGTWIIVMSMSMFDIARSEDWLAYFLEELVDRPHFDPEGPLKALAELKEKGGATLKLIQTTVQEYGGTRCVETLAIDLGFGPVKASSNDDNPYIDLCDLAQHAILLQLGLR